MGVFGPKVDTKLIKAVEKGNVDDVHKLLEKKVPLNVPDKEGNTALHWAVRKGNIPIVELLLEAGVDIHHADKIGRTVLHKTAYSGNHKLTALLLENGADIAVGDKWGDTALHLAGKWGHTLVVVELLKHGANPYATDKDGRTCMDVACSGTHVYIPKEVMIKVLTSEIGPSTASAPNPAAQGSDSTSSSSPSFHSPVQPSSASDTSQTAPPPSLDPPLPDPTTIRANQTPSPSQWARQQSAPRNPAFMMELVAADNPDSNMDTHLAGETLHNTPLVSQLPSTESEWQSIIKKLARRTPSQSRLNGNETPSPVAPISPDYRGFQQQQPSPSAYTSPLVAAIQQIAVEPVTLPHAMANRQQSVSVNDVDKQDSQSTPTGKRTPTPDMQNTPPPMRSPSSSYLRSPHSGDNLMPQASVGFSSHAWSPHAERLQSVDSTNVEKARSGGEQLPMPEGGGLRRQALGGSALFSPQAGTPLSVGFSSHAWSPLSGRGTPPVFRTTDSDQTGQSAEGNASVDSKDGLLEAKRSIIRVVLKDEHPTDQASSNNIISTVKPAGKIDTSDSQRSWMEGEWPPNGKSWTQSSQGSAGGPPPEFQHLYPTPQESDEVETPNAASASKLVTAEDDTAMSPMQPAVQARVDQIKQVNQVNPTASTATLVTFEVPAVDTRAGGEPEVSSAAVPDDPGSDLQLSASTVVVTETDGVMGGGGGSGQSGFEPWWPEEMEQADTADADAADSPKDVQQVQVVVQKLEAATPFKTAEEMGTSETLAASLPTAAPAAEGAELASGPAADVTQQAESAPVQQEGVPVQVEEARPLAPDVPKDVAAHAATPMSRIPASPARSSPPQLFVSASGPLAASIRGLQTTTSTSSTSAIPSSPSVPSALLSNVSTTSTIVPTSINPRMDMSRPDFSFESLWMQSMEAKAAKINMPKSSNSFLADSDLLSPFNSTSQPSITRGPTAGQQVAAILKAQGAMPPRAAPAAAQQAPSKHAPAPQPPVRPAAVPPTAARKLERQPSSDGRALPLQAPKLERQRSSDGRMALPGVQPPIELRRSGSSSGMVINARIPDSTAEVLILQPPRSRQQAQSMQVQDLPAQSSSKAPAKQPVQLPPQLPPQAPPQAESAQHHVHHNRYNISGDTGYKHYDLPPAPPASSVYPKVHNKDQAKQQLPVTMANAPTDYPQIYPKSAATADNTAAAATTATAAAAVAKEPAVLQPSPVVAAATAQKAAMVSSHGAVSLSDWTPNPTFDLSPTCSTDEVLEFWQREEAGELMHDARLSFLIPRSILSIREGVLQSDTAFYGTTVPAARGDKQLALKIYNYRLLGRMDRREAVEESLALACARHNNLVSCYGVVDDFGTSKAASITGSLVTEWVGGGSLYHWLQENHHTLTLVARVKLALQVADGMRFLHSQGITHGALKPLSVLVVPAPEGVGAGYVPEVKISDFGLAHHTSSSLTTKVASSHLEYTSPERTRTYQLTQSDDIYAFGIMMYFLATSRSPFPHIPAGQLREAVRDGVRPNIGEWARKQQKGSAGPPVALFYSTLAQECWDEDASSRPDFSAIYAKLKAILDTHAA